jgi:hypothetical protein
LSLVTLLSAGVIEVLGLDAAIIATHLLSSLMLLGLGYLVAREVASLASRSLGWLAGAGVVLFPLMVSQSAYLYTELPSAVFVFISIVLALRRYPYRSTVALTVAVLIKPLAIVALPTILLVLWRRRVGRGAMLVPTIALAALIPAFLIPQPPRPATPALAAIGVVLETSWAWAVRSPEMLILSAVPIVAYLVLRRSGSSDEEWTWLWICSSLLASFLAFFSLNAVATAGWFFIPRYFAMLLGPIMVLLALIISRLRPVAQVGVAGLILAISMLGIRGPLAWGTGSYLPPVTERSLAFLDLYEEHRVGLARLADLGADGWPIFHDHYASYAFAYPELGMHSGEVENATTVRSGDWGTDLSELPDRFAMLVQLPFLGGERLINVKRMAEADQGYRVSTELVGSADQLPVQIVTVERVDADPDPPGG